MARGRPRKQVRLGKIDRACIEGMLAHGISISAIARKLNKPLHAVEEYVNIYTKNQKQAQEKKVETTTTPTNDQSVTENVAEKAGFVTTTSAKHNKGITLMTQTASMHVDEVRQKTANTIPNNRKKDIHIINPNK